MTDHTPTYAISYETDENLGDHGRIVTLPVQFVLGETVADLIDRATQLHGKGWKYKTMGKYDRIIIQRIEVEHD